jgi:leucyl aminopeptidase
MEFLRFDGAIDALDADLVAVGVGKGDWPADCAAAVIDAKLGGLLKEVAGEEGFEGKDGQSVLLHTHGKISGRRVLLIGLDTSSDTAGRTLASRASRRARSLGITSLGIAADGASERWSVIGAVLGVYTFDKWRTQNVKQLNLASVAIHGGGDPCDMAVAAESAAAVTLARDLVNEPPQSNTPTHMAETAEAIAKEYGMEITVFDKAALEKKGMRLILAVSAGSVEEPRLIHMTYRPKNATADTPSVALVGKGLTFDAGGLCLKPTGSIEDMKMDMGGGAAVLGAMKAIGAIQPDVIVHGIVPSSENMLGAAAYRPGDIYRSYLGKTVEILNTDAEGRLILADALAYAVEQEPDEIIDLATLTGAICVALGNGRCGLFSNNDDMADAVQTAFDSAGEGYWRMPLDQSLRKQLNTPNADMKNVGKRWGGAITAALFLEEFVSDATWTHLDIAGPAFADKSTDHIHKGGTGFAVLTLAEYARAAGARLRK